MQAKDPSDLRVRLLVVASVMVALVAAAACEVFPGPVLVAWQLPASGSTLSGAATLRFTGQSMANVEVFSGSQMIGRATPSSDGTSATATIATSGLPNGPVTLSAHAWNSTPGTEFSADADAGARTFTVSNGPVQLGWQAPGSGATISGTATLRLTGQSLVNVEVFRGSQVVSRATVAPDGRSATATLDTRTLPNGSITLSAHGWNRPAGATATSEADAGTRSFVVANTATTTTTAPASTTTTTAVPSTTTTRPSTTTTTTTTTTPPTGGDFHPAGYALVSADEFDGSSLDRAKWCTRMIYGGGAPLQVPDAACQRNGDGTLDFLNDEQERYVDTNRAGETMHRVSGGTLSLRATRTRTDDSWATYESAMIRSKELFRPSSTRSYYLTARVRLPDVVGTWPAFWINSDRRADGTTSWPPEIDFFEGALNGRDDRVEMLHQATIIRGQQTSSGNREITFSAPEYDRQWGNYNASSSLRARWIEVGAEWTATGVCSYVDGYRTVCENYRWVYDDGSQAPPAHVLVNLAIGGGWAGRYGIDAARFPTSLDIDHVRIYSKG